MLISIGELIKRSYNLYKDNFTTILKYLLLMLIPAIFIFLFKNIIKLTIVKFGATMSPILFVLIPLLSLVLIAAIALGMWFNFALIKVIDLLNKKMPAPPIKDALKEAKAVIWRGFGATILVGIYSAWPLFLGLIALAISNRLLHSQILNAIFGLVATYGIFHLVYFSIKLIFTAYSVVLDNKKIREALKTSASLTQKRWWGVLSRAFTPAIAAYLVVMIIN